MSISIITPTEERPERLLRLYGLLQAQEVSDWEWLIYDCSLRPCRELQECRDPRLRYTHTLDRKSVGKRRNLMIHGAISPLIVHCDDDDYYAPEYLNVVKTALSTTDFFYMHSWFAYHEGSFQFFYWDSQVSAPRRMVVNPLVGARIREMDFGREMAVEERGMGFTFAYRKDLAIDHPFLDQDKDEDQAFLRASHGRRSTSLADRDGLVMKVIHSSNASCIYPQYMIPRFMMKLTHPHLVAYEDLYSCCR